LEEGGARQALAQNRTRRLFNKNTKLCNTVVCIKFDTCPARLI